MKQASKVFTSVVVEEPSTLTSSFFTPNLIEVYRFHQLSFFKYYVISFSFDLADEQRLTNSALDYSSHLSPLDQRLVNQFDRGVFFFSNGRI